MGEALLHNARQGTTVGELVSGEGLVSKAHSFCNHSILGSRVTKKKGDTWEPMCSSSDRTRF